MGKGVWGIDVSRYSVKAVRMEPTKEGILLTELEVLNYDVVGKIQEAELETRIRDALKQLKHSKRIGSEKIVISLPTHSHYNRLVKLPPFGDMAMAIQHEARQQIPIPLEEAIWGYQIVERQYNPGEEKDVILLAIKKDTVQAFLKILDEVGLNVDQIQLSPVAVYNFLAYDQEAGASTVVLEMGAENGSLIVLENDRFWVRNLPLAGNDITKAIQEGMNIPFDKAEQLKINALQSPQAERIYEAVMPVYKNIVSEIHRSLGYYKSISKSAKFDRILLLGNGTRSLNFQRFMGQALQIQATKIQKLNKITLSVGVDAGVLNNQLQSLATALGLALQGCGVTRNQVNLLPEAYIVRKQFRKKYPVVGLAIVLLYVTWFLAYSETDKRIQGIESVYKQTTEAEKKANEAVERYKRVKEVKFFADELNLFGHIGVDRAHIRNVMEEVLKNFPDNFLAGPDHEKVWLMDMQVDLWDGDPPVKGAMQQQNSPVIQVKRTLTFKMYVAITRYMINKVGGDTQGQAPRNPEEGGKFVREKLNLNKLKFGEKAFPGNLVNVAPDGLTDDIKLEINPPTPDAKFLKYVVRFNFEATASPAAPPVPPK